MLVSIGINANAYTNVNTMTNPPTSDNSTTKVKSSGNMIANTDISISISLRTDANANKITGIDTNLRIPYSTNPIVYVFDLT